MALQNNQVIAQKLFPAIHCFLHAPGIGLFDVQMVNMVGFSGLIKQSGSMIRRLPLPIISLRSWAGISGRVGSSPMVKETLLLSLFKQSIEV